MSNVFENNYIDLNVLQFFFNLDKVILLVNNKDGVESV